MGVHLVIQQYPSVITIESSNKKLIRRTDKVEKGGRCFIVYLA